MKVLIVIIVGAAVAVVAILAMDSIGGPGSSGSSLRTAIAGGVAGAVAVFVAGRNRKS